MKVETNKLSYYIGRLKEVKESYGLCGKVDIFVEVAKKNVLLNLPRIEGGVPPFTQSEKSSKWNKKQKMAKSINVHCI